MNTTNNEWPLFLLHNYHPTEESAFVFLPDTVSFEEIYRKIAYIQHKHSEGCYKTEDLSGLQMAFILKSILGFETDVLGGEQISSMSEYLDEIGAQDISRHIDLFWNWEQGVVKFFSDKDLREQGKTPYFYPEINIDDYAITNLEETFKKMDEHFK